LVVVAADYYHSLAVQDSLTKQMAAQFSSSVVIRFLEKADQSQ